MIKIQNFSNVNGKLAGRVVGTGMWRFAAIILIQASIRQKKSHRICRKIDGYVDKTTGLPPNQKEEIQ